MSSVNFFYSRKVLGHEIWLQIHRDVSRDQAPRGRAVGGDVGSDPAKVASSSSGEAEHESQGPIQGPGPFWEGLERPEQQVEILRQLARALNGKFIPLAPSPPSTVYVLLCTTSPSWYPPVCMPRECSTIDDERRQLIGGLWLENAVPWELMWFMAPGKEQEGPFSTKSADESCPFFLRKVPLFLLQTSPI